MRRTRRMWVAVGVLVAWVAITAVGASIRYPDATDLTALVTGGVAWQLAAAGGFLVAVVAITRWDGLGFHTPRRGTLRLLWLPAVYIALVGVLVAAVGLPPGAGTALILVNTVLVGFSEELMFRGVLFAAFRSRLEIWPSIWATSLLFGAVHLLNVGVTGDLAVAGLQAVAAFLNGVHLQALRIRTASLWPAVAVHAAWDGALFLAAVGLMRQVPTGLPAGAAEVPVGAALAAPLLVAPLFLYGLYLLRRVRG